MPILVLAACNLVTIGITISSILVLVTMTIHYTRYTNYNSIIRIRTKTN